MTPTAIRALRPGDRVQYTTLGTRQTYPAIVTGIEYDTDADDYAVYLDIPARGDTGWGWSDQISAMPDPLTPADAATLGATDAELTEALVRAALLAAGYAESPPVDYTDAGGAVQWAYGFIVGPADDGAIIVELWDQIFSFDRTPAQADAYRAQLARYGAALEAAGLAATWAEEPGRLPWLEVRGVGWKK